MWPESGLGGYEVTSTTRSVVIGAACAVVVVAVGVGVLLMRGGAAGGASGGVAQAAPSKVVVVFAFPDEDNVVTAQLVATVDYATGAYQVEDTSATVSIPGTSYTMLRDAYPFGGAEAVASALADGKPVAGTAWVDVSPAAWTRLLKTGVEVTLTAPFDTFEDATDHYSEFIAGSQHVAATDLWGLVNGAVYLDAQDRGAIRGALAAASLRELVSTGPSQGITTNLTAEQWAAFAKVLGRR